MFFEETVMAMTRGDVKPEMLAQVTPTQLQGSIEEPDHVASALCGSMVTADLKVSRESPSGERHDPR